MPTETDRAKQLSLGADLSLSERVRYYGSTHRELSLFCNDLAEKIETLELELHAVKSHAKFGDEEPYADHAYCVVCRECVTCNLRPCRDGGEHKIIAEKS